MADTIVRLGVDFRRAALAVREHLSLSAPAAADFLGKLQPELASHGIREIAVLSTCNRTELYFVAEGGIGAAPWLIDGLKRMRPNVGPLYEECSRYSSENEFAVRELLRVAAGLESQILGDSQILVQVRKAWETAQQARTGGKLLECAFRSAVQAGKRVRAEAQLSAGAAGIGPAVLRTFRRLSPHAAKTLILGAGEAARAAALHLSKARGGGLLFSARNETAAEALAKEFRGTVVPWQNAGSALSDAGVVIAATAARLELLSMARLGGRQTPLLIIDLGVPRNADPELAAIPAITLINLDSLDQEQQHALARRSTQVPLAEAILEEELERWRRRMAWLKVEPAVKQWYLDAETARRELLVHLPVHNKADLLTSRMVKRLLDRPVRQLRRSILCPGV